MKKILIAVVVAAAAGCAGMSAQRDDLDAKTVAVLKASFKSRGQATIDRLDQDEVQKLCSGVDAQHPLDDAAAKRVEQSQAATIRYPQGSLLGDWKSGEKIAQSGVGKQYSDDPKAVAGGNCYACHELAKAELAYGTIGPSLHNFGRIRGFTPEMQRYVYAKVYNPQAFSACSSMPRFGYHGILTEQQIKDVVALLMDPASPVNN